MEQLEPQLVLRIVFTGPNQQLNMEFPDSINPATVVHMAHHTEPFVF